MFSGIRFPFQPTCEASLSEHLHWLSWSVHSCSVFFFFGKSKHFQEFSKIFKDLTRIKTNQTHKKISATTNKLAFFFFFFLLLIFFGSPSLLGGCQGRALGRSPQGGGCPLTGVLGVHLGACLSLLRDLFIYSVIFGVRLFFGAVLAVPVEVSVDRRSWAGALWEVSRRRGAAGGAGRAEAARRTRIVPGTLERRRRRDRGQGKVSRGREEAVGETVMGDWESLRTQPRPELMGVSNLALLLAEFLLIFIYVFMYLFLY